MFYNNNFLMILRTKILYSLLALFCLGSFLKAEEITLLSSGASGWNYNDKGSDLGSDWKESTYDDSGWESGVAPLGYASTSKSTYSLLNTYITKPSTSLPTMYFRKSIEISADVDLDKFAIECSYLIDDGCFVYINGTQIISYNVTDDCKDYSVYQGANGSAIGDASLNTVTLSGIASDYFTTGTNYICVMLKNNAATSSDAIVDMEITASPIPDTIVKSSSSNWYYNNQGNELGDGWTDVDYDADSWSIGQAPIGYASSSSSIYSLLNTDLTQPSSSLPTTYYRKTFEIDSDVDLSSLSISGNHLIDDGCFIYINSTLVYSYNVNDDCKDYNVYQSSYGDAIGSADWDSFELSGTADYFLNNGTNVISIMLKNNASTSSDAIMDIELLLKEAEETTAADSLEFIIDTLTEENYSIPSWTLLKIAETSLDESDEETIEDLEDAINDLQPKTMPFTINCTFNGDPTSQMGFNWYTNNGVTSGKIQVVEGEATSEDDFSSPDFEVDASYTELDNLNYCNSANYLESAAGIANGTDHDYITHKAVVSGLSAGNTYSYRVGQEGSWSSIGSFMTADGDAEPDFSFIYMTDPQSNTQAMFETSRITAAASYAQVADAKFAMICGDLVETSGSSNAEWEWEQFFETNKDVYMKFPLAPVQGNHDHSSNNTFGNHFNTDGSFDEDLNKSTTPGSVYSFVYDGVLFMALNSEDYGVSGYLDSMKVWMRKEVAKYPDVRWRFVYYHKAIYSGANHHSDSDVKVFREAMTPLFDSLDIDVAWQGHDHVYEVLGPINSKELAAFSIYDRNEVEVTDRDNITGYLNGIFNVSRGTLYFLNNSSGTKKYEPKTEAQMTALESTTEVTNYFGLFTGRFGQNGYPTFSDIHVTYDTITIRTYYVDDDGATSMFDSIKVVKSEAKRLVEASDTLTMDGYTTPSWTAFKRALKLTSKDMTDGNADSLQNAIDDLKGRSNPYNIVMSINRAPSANMGFAWFTNGNELNGELQIAEGTFTDTTEFISNAESIDASYTEANSINYNTSANNLSELADIDDNTSKSYVSHKALASGLKYNKTYTYRVGTEGAWSELATFTTANSKSSSFSFSYLTDTRVNDDSTINNAKRVISAAVQAAPESNFLLFAGNMVESSGVNNSEWEYEQWFESNKDVLAKYPVVPVCGNRDQSTNQNFSLHFNTAENFDSTMSTLPGSNYSFIYGNTLFMGLNLEEFDNSDYISDLKSWMSNQISINSDVDWKIIFFNKAIYTGSTSQQADPDAKVVRDSVESLISELDIDLALQGYDNLYEVVGPVNNKALVENCVFNTTEEVAGTEDNMKGISGGQFNVKSGTLYFLNGSAGPKHYLPKTEEEMDASASSTGISDYYSLFTGRLGQPGISTFSNIDVTSDSINIYTYTVDVKNNVDLFDAYSIVKHDIAESSAVDMNEDLSISVFPTVVDASLQSLNTTDSEVTLEIFSLFGKKVLESVLPCGYSNIDVSALSSGSYLVVVSDGIKTQTFRVVKK